jgi:nicotine oxidoreductase
LEESQKTLHRLERLRQLNTDRSWLNADIYRLLYKEDLYIVAYERMKSAPGNMTPGSDGNTIDRFSLSMIQQIIQEMRTEQFQFQPVRTVFIPQPNGKKRKLGIPCVRDKIVQEVIRILLECMYDSPYGPYFHETSHGFRATRSCHTALREIRGNWSASNWFLEGDISQCFDAIDHGVLVSVLRKKIRDERFLNLIWKLLRAGYLDLQEARQDSLAGTPQGGIASPILANIYLHELDEKGEEIRKRLEQGGKRKRRNPLGKKLSEQKRRLAKKGATRTQEFRELVRRMRNMPSGVVNDPNFIRIKYLRYADDWVVGICGPRTLAEQIKEELKSFLKESLKLRLSEEKTCITQARTEQAQFLGTLCTLSRGGIQKVVTLHQGTGKPIKRRSTGSEVILLAPKKKRIQKLHTKGFCTTDGKPTTKSGWIYLDADQIIGLYNGINRGIQNYYRFTDNFDPLATIQYILKFSLAKTFAAKYKCSVSQVFSKFGKALTVTVTTENGKRDRQVSFFLNSDWTKQRFGFQIGKEALDLLRWGITLRTRSKLGKTCCICNASTQVEMHQVRHIRKTGGKKPTGFKAILRAMNRKQIPVCTSCHQKIHSGEYDNMGLSDLAYNPYESEKRRGFRESCMQ